MKMVNMYRQLPKVDNLRRKSTIQWRRTVGTSDSLNKT